VKTFAILLARASSESSCMSGPLMKGESDISLLLKTAVVLGLKYRKVGAYGSFAMPWKSLQIWWVFGVKLRIWKTSL